MAIYIYNTLTRKKEEFRPLNPPEVKMYTCGVTVYDDCHIGHARSLYIFEVIRRYFRYRGFKVSFVRNITDVDDKIIDKAREWKQKKNISLEEALDLVRETYINSYYRDLKELSIPPADKEPKATENIEDMNIFFQKLSDKGFAYESGGNVYFSVRKFPSYGKLSGKKIDDLRSAVRIETDPLKKDPLDFALWKSKKEDEPFWESGMSAVDDGRPGWHIECSVMAQKYLGETLDIHGGGRDLIFPHHENEIAQSEALTGKTFARCWIHHGLLTINGQKMAKSLGNFVTIKDFICEYRDPDILKLFFLSTHYSNPVDYTKEKIEDCKKQKKSFDDFFEKIGSWRLREGRLKTATSEKDRAKIEDTCLKFEQAMDDNFNTPAALASLFELMDLALGFVSCDKEDAFNYAESKLRIFFSIFGLNVGEVRKISQEVEAKRKERDLARDNKDFTKADAIRKEIERKFHYVVSDTAGGSALTYISEQKKANRKNQENAG